MEKYKVSAMKQKITPNREDDIKKSQIEILELRNITTEIKTSEYRFNSRMEETEERIKKVEDETKQPNRSNREKT